MQQLAIPRIEKDVDSLFRAANWLSTTASTFDLHNLADDTAAIMMWCGTYHMALAKLRGSQSVPDITHLRDHLLPF